MMVSEMDRQTVLQWLEKFRSGTLTEKDLEQALGGARTQRLLYLQCRSTAVDSEVLGMALVENGELLEGPENPGDWPYASVGEAMKDGWRILKFPELSLQLHEDKTVGFGCEFILEK